MQGGSAPMLTPFPLSSSNTYQKPLSLGFYKKLHLTVEKLLQASLEICVYDSAKHI